MLERVLEIGTVQLLIKHVNYQLNTTCRFDSIHIEASLRAANEYVVLYTYYIYEWNTSANEDFNVSLQGYFERYEKVYNAVSILSRLTAGNE